MTFESGVVLDDGRTGPLYRDKGEMTKCKKYRGISRLSTVGKNFGILVDKIHRVTEALIDYDRGGFKPGRGCAHQTFTLNNCVKNQKK